MAQFVLRIVHKDYFITRQLTTKADYNILPAMRIHQWNVHWLHRTRHLSVRNSPKEQTAFDPKLRRFTILRLWNRSFPKQQSLNCAETTQPLKLRVICPHKVFRNSIGRMFGTSWRTGWSTMTMTMTRTLREDPDHQSETWPCGHE